MVNNNTSFVLVMQIYVLVTSPWQTALFAEKLRATRPHLPKGMVYVSVLIVIGCIWFVFGVGD